MLEALKNFPAQFSFEPEIQNGSGLKKYNSFVVLGMGGSHLAADLLKIWDSSFNIYVHSNYGLPQLPEPVLKDSLVIASSYSGNTEEVLDGFEAALERGLALCAVSIGGKLLELCEKNSIPYARLPNTGIQPRAALGFALRALLKIMGEEKVLADTKALASDLSGKQAELKGRELAAKLENSIPVIYASAVNGPLAYNWKIKFNETSKIPSFANVLPELNHNEMTGFDAAGDTRILSQNFHFILLRDIHDHPKIVKRMDTLEKLYRDRKLPVTTLDLDTKSGIFYKIFSNLLIADWTSFYLARFYGVEAEAVPMVEEFKKLI